MDSIDNLLETLGIVRKAIKDQNKAKGLEAVTVLLGQFMHSFGHATNLVSKTFPTLKELKNHIESEEFDEALPILLALTGTLRQAQKAMTATS